MVIISSGRRGGMRGSAGVTPMQPVEESIESVLQQAGLKRAQINYIASTGEGETLPGTTGHFYSMTTHARGAIYLNPEARAVLDIGALNGRALLAQLLVNLSILQVESLHTQIRWSQADLHSFCSGAALRRPSDWC